MMLQVSDSTIAPCDVFVFGSAKSKIRKAMKDALNTDEHPSMLISCDELHKAIHELRADDIIQCWMNIAHQTIDELNGKSASFCLMLFVPSCCLCLT